MVNFRYIYNSTKLNIAVSKFLIKAGLLSILAFQVLCAFPQAKSSRYSKDKSVIAHGQSIFQQKCAACHNFKQQGIGPNLTGITSVMPAKWISDFILNSQQLVKKGDKRAVA